LGLGALYAGFDLEQGTEGALSYTFLVGWTSPPKIFLKMSLGTLYGVFDLEQGTEGMVSHTYCYDGLAISPSILDHTEQGMEGGPLPPIHS
jgi:hypothetical protein